MKKVLFVAAGLFFGGLVGVVSADESDFGKGNHPPIMRQEIPISSNALPEQAGGGRISRVEVPCSGGDTDTRFFCARLISR